MPGDLEKICKLLEEGAPDVQAAAALILGELKAVNGTVEKALLEAAKSAHDGVRLNAIEALARINPKSALPYVVPLLAAPPAVRSRAVAMAVEMGAPAAKLLESKFEKADSELRKGILEALGKLKGGGERLFEALLDPDLEVVKQATAAIRQQIEGAEPGARSKMVKRVETFLGSAKVRKERSATVAGLKLLGFLHDPGAVKTLLDHMGPKEHPIVRFNALYSLANLELSADQGQKLFSKIVPLVGEENFGEIVQPTLQVLYRIKVTQDQVEALRTLIKNRHPQVRVYAVKALGSIGSALSARALVDALFSDDPEIADTASGSLRSNPAFAPVLLKALSEEEELAKAWKIANVLRSYRDVVDRKTLRQFVAKCMGLLRKKDGRFQVYFEILRSAAPAELREAILKEGRAQFTSRKWAEAERILKLLDRDDLFTPESEFALAAAQLSQQRKDVATAGRDATPALEHFSRLVRRGDVPIVKNLEKEAARFGAATLLYLGFAFIERQGVEREFGAGVLKLVARKFSRSNEGKVARQKLKTQGIG